MKKKVIGISIGVILIEVIIWFGLYRLFGYNETTLLISEAVVFIYGTLCIVLLKLDTKKIGLDLKKLLNAFLILMIVHLILAIIAYILNKIGTNLTIFRDQYQLKGFYDMWLLIGVGEELIFTAVLYNLTKNSGIKVWKVILIVAGIFTLFHVPGYLAIYFNQKSSEMDIILGMLTNFSSWIFLGLIYAISKNFYLTAFTHASMDYPLLRMITQNPFMGFIFLTLIILIAYLYNKKIENTPIYPY